MKNTLKIFLLFFFSFQIKAQILFYQNTYRGGISVDGRAYEGFDYLQPDTINFANTAPIGSVIKKAFLISHRGFTSSVEKDNYLQLFFNNNVVILDSLDIITNTFQCDYSFNSAKNWIVVKDVTSFAHNSGNKLLVPTQVPLDIFTQYVYAGFLLVLIYEDISMPVANAVIYLNNMTDNSNLTYSFSGLNKINTINDVGLSVYTNDPAQDSITFNLYSSVGNTNLGSIGLNFTSTPDSVYHYAPGSFYYDNNTLFGLKDDNPNNGFDTTDALVNIKNYVANNAQTFTINTTQKVNSACDNLIDAFILAYTTTCPTRSNKDTTLVYNICHGSNPVALSVNSNTTNSTYSWYSADGSLSSATTASVIVTPTVTTNYIAYIDSAGCKHTEHFKVSVYNLPQIDSIYTTNIICGNNNILGVATITGYNGTRPYQYSVGGTNQTSSTFTNIPVGTYTVGVTDSMGCKSAQKSFVITQINIAQVNFTPQPDTGCVPATVYFNNTGNTNFNEWYVNGDSINTQNLNYTFTDTGTYSIKLIGWRNLRMCSDTIIKTVHIKDCPPDSIHISVPNIFSPNADGINDSWQLTVNSYQYTVSNYQCTIYDRWGIKVFEATNLSQAWDGRSTSDLACSSGAYFYVIKLTATNSKGVAEQKNFKGYLELLR